MTNVAEKVVEAKEKPAVSEKRRALGRGLESLLPGPRVVAGSAVNSVSPRTPAAGPPTVAPPSAASTVDGVLTQAASVPTASQSAREGSAVDPRSSGPVTPGATSSAEEPTESRAASPMAGLERAVVRNENIGTASLPTRVATHATHSSLAPQSPQTTETSTVGMGGHAPTLSQSARKDGAPMVGSGAVHASQVSVTEPREPGAPSGLSAPLANGVGDLQGVAEPSDFEGVQVTELPLDKIDPNPYQTRHFTAEDEDELIELGQSIKAQGLIQPITVREGKNGRYVLIAGDRRTRASRLAELKTIPAIIWDVTEQQAAEMTVIENLMREDLNCMDQTRAFVLLSSKFQMTQAEIASRMGMSRESVSNYMRLSRLPQEVQDYLINNELEYSHARLLLKIDNDDVLVKVARKVAKEHIPVWELEEMMLSSNPTLLKPPDEKKESRGARWVDPNVKAAQRDLERVLGMRVRIRDRNNKGRIVIEYSTLEDFDRVVGALRGKGGR